MTSEIDRTLVALAHPTRRAILDRLARGESRVTALAGPFNISLNSISKHIKMLERAGLVKRRRVGREHLLSYNHKPIDKAAAWIEAQRTHWDAAFDQMARVLEDEA
jgi:DNA-binding transcriptional ArsR family regulator